jgi:hypothetical protein
MFLRSMVASILAQESLACCSVHPAGQDEKEELPGLKDEIHLGSLANWGGETSPFQTTRELSGLNSAENEFWIDEKTLCFCRVFGLGWVF